MLPPDTDWTKREIVLDVPRDAASFNYGVGIAGPGVMWFDAPTMEIVDASVPVTPQYEGEEAVGDWLKTGVGAADFTLALDGKDVRVERKDDASKRFVAVVRTVDATPFVGKKIKAELDIKTDGLDGDAVCLVKVQAERELTYSHFLAVESKPVSKSTKDFEHCALETTIPTGAKFILYGISYRGAGKAWLRGGTLK